MTQFFHFLLPHLRFPSSVLPFSVRHHTEMLVGWMMAENSPQRKNKTSGTETEHYLNTERVWEHQSVAVIQAEEEDSFPVMSHNVWRVLSSSSPLRHSLIPQRITHFLSFWTPIKTCDVKMWQSVTHSEDVGNWPCPSTWTSPCCLTPLQTVQTLVINSAGGSSITQEIRPMGWMTGFLRGKGVLCLLAWV